MSGILINVAQDYSEFPTGRYKKHGAGSGEEFRDKFLAAALAKGGDVTVILDGTSGYPSSFLEEAFGGLVRLGISIDKLKKHLKIIAETASFEPYRILAWDYMERAAAQSRKD